MPEYKFDITILTAAKFLHPPKINWYVQQILDEDRMVKSALEQKGFKVLRTSWDDPSFDWRKTEYILFRTIWDYFDRFREFTKWLETVKSKTRMINPYRTIRWNMDKHYLTDLAAQDINAPPTLFIEAGDQRSLHEIVSDSGWDEIILKPAVSGAGRHTYRLTCENTGAYEHVFRQLIGEESMMVQEFQHQVVTKGEVAYILFNGKYSHAILKKAKPGDFRVQDDFGGTVHEYLPTASEIHFAEKVTALCNPVPAYARVDVIYDNKDQLCVSELELIEPELWFRKYPGSADRLAQVIFEKINR